MRHGIVNASIALVSDKAWRLALIGKKLGDTPYSTMVPNNPSLTITRRVPCGDERCASVTFRHHF
jgi:hypothetical protein